MPFEKTTDAQLRNRYSYHAPKPDAVVSGMDQAQRYEQIRAIILVTASLIRDLTPISPEQARAFNALDEAMFLANAAIARNE